jgi:hypothetical protein
MKKQIATDLEYENERLNALIAVMAKTGWTIKPYRLVNWRATIETSGYLVGLEELGELTLYATDGILGLFKRHDTGKVDTYHTHRPSNKVSEPQEKIFTGKIIPLVKKSKRRFNDTDADGKSIKPARKRNKSEKQKRIDILNLL